MSYRPYQQITRRKSRRVYVGKVPVGDGAPITVQTMTNTLTTDVAGTVRARVFFASSAVDTDVTVKLVDVAEAGDAIVLCDNILRCRFRNSQAHPELLKPDEVNELLITVGNIAHRFQQGHRIRLDISSSNFPRFLPNSNTGSDEATIGAADMKRAVNRVFHDEDHMSCLILPHVPRD